MLNFILIITMFFAGDAMQHTPQIASARVDSTHTFDYSPCFQYLRPYLQETDLNIVNFETTLSGEPYSGFPAFSSPDEWLYDLQNAGFNVFSLANNHVIDMGQPGLERTLDHFADTYHMGAYLDSADRENRYPLLLTIHNLKIAFCCCTYGTNDNVPRRPNIINYIDTAQIRQDLQKAQDCDIRVMFIHWGEEYQLEVNNAQKRMAQWLADAGFDLIVGSHPHVVQKADYLSYKSENYTVDNKVGADSILAGALVNVMHHQLSQNVPVAYSLGNFISNQRWTNSNGGACLQVEIDEDTKKITQVNVLPVYVYKGVLNGKDQYYIIPTTDYLRGRLPFMLPSDAEQQLRKCHHRVIEQMADFPLLTHPVRTEIRKAYPLKFLPLE